MSDEFLVSLALGNSLQDAAMNDGFLVRLAFRPSPEKVLMLCIYEITFSSFPQYHQ